MLFISLNINKVKLFVKTYRKIDIVYKTSYSIYMQVYAVTTTK